MKSYKLVHQLLTLVEDLERETGKEATFQDFTGFVFAGLHESAAGLANKEIRFGEKESKAQYLAFQVDNNISRLITFMSRYAKVYIKKALNGTQLQTQEEFTCLAILLTHDDMSKTELISHNIQEKTSGTVIINRLIKAGLIKQGDNQHDKRGKRISITDAGKELLYQVFEHTTHVGKIVTGKLSPSEKLTLQYLLQKLEEFHYQVHDSKKITKKEDLAELAKSL